MKSRIYTVTTKADGSARLVQATSRAQALSHVARASFEVAAASSVAVGSLMSKGVKLEQAATDAGDDGEVEQ